MDDLIGKFDELGFDILGLDNIVYTAIDPGQKCDSCTTCGEGCKPTCATCQLGCSNGPT